jgi:peptidoglycan L-alanyl-D-glutamate endopeptidase CwlK
MTFALGQTSKNNLVGVHCDLVRVVKRAIELSTVDYRVHEGLRSVLKQKANVLAGVSWTMNGRHVTGHAVDLVPWRDTDGDGDCELSWDWPSCYEIARAMQKAACELKIPIVWGGVWDMKLNDLSPNLEAEVKRYAARRKKLGKAVKLDGPHYELARAAYP